MATRRANHAATASPATAKRGRLRVMDPPGLNSLNSLNSLNKRSAATTWAWLLIQWS